MIDTMLDLLKSQRQSRIDDMLKQPEIAAAAEKIFSRTVRWGEKYGYGIMTATPVNPNEIKAAKITEILREDSNVSASYKDAYAKMFEVILESPITWREPNKGTSMKYLTGTCVVMLTDPTGGASVPLNTPLFVINGAEFLAWSPTGDQTNAHLSYSPKDMTIPASSEAVQTALAGFLVDGGETAINFFQGYCVKKTRVNDVGVEEEIVEEELPI